MKSLGISASSDFISVAVHEEEHLSLNTMSSKRLHTELGYEMIESQLRNKNLDKTEREGIMLDIGPDS